MGRMTLQTFVRLRPRALAVLANGFGPASLTDSVFAPPIPSRKP
jgi:hypothetical protein